MQWWAQCLMHTFDDEVAQCCASQTVARSLCLPEHDVVTEGMQESDHDKKPPPPPLPFKHIVCWLQLWESVMPHLVAALEERGLRDVSAKVVYAKLTAEETLSYQMSKMAG